MHLNATLAQGKSESKSEVKSDIGRLHFLTQTFAETFAEPKLRSKYLLKSKSEVISLSENTATNMDSLVN